MKLYNRLLPYFLIFTLIIFSTLLLWLPYLLRQINWLGLNIEKSSFEYIYRHFDGVFYIISAKTLYEVNKINIPGIGFILSLPLSPIYFAAHLPLYPLFIRLFAVIFGYLKAMLFVNVIFTILLCGIFFHLIKKFKLSGNPLTLVFVFLFLPRFLVVRSVGAPESLFIFLILSSLYFFELKNYFLAGVLGGLSAATKIPGTLLFITYFLVFLEEFIKTKKFNWRWSYIFFIPLGLIIVFYFYLIQYGDFFAFFHSTAVVPMPYPLSVFNWRALWVGTAWLEEIVFYFFLYTLTVINLFRTKQRSFFYFSLIYLISLIFIQHRDIARYSLPLWPIACLVFEKHFTSKKFLIALLLILPVIYFYAWNFLSYNILPISDWKPFL